MPKYQIMDHTGHSTKEWDKADKVAVAEAKKRFQELTAKGFSAFDPAVGRLKAFDPNVETVLFVPSLQGG